ncbi:General substrate transporter [Artemisia annua]|uniref:General substrate transporter n=1 Tax=Artemisia annua TaxID=35608 RepID=A0A2U1KXD0_ARTAN|nr:General substrate transporter [Artemisia annua]
MGDQGYTYTLDEALSTIGFGKFQVGVLAYAGLAIQPEWGLSSSEESLISTVAFFGMLVGAYLWGVVSDSYGRKQAYCIYPIPINSRTCISPITPEGVGIYVHHGFKNHPISIEAYGCKFINFSGQLEQSGGVTCLELPGVAIAAFTLDRIGRKICMEILMICGLILLLPLVVHQNAIMTAGFLFGSRMFVSVSFTVASIYAPEVYPTNVRATGVGITTAVGKIGGMVCPLIAVGMGSGCHQTLPVILFEVTILLSGLSILLLPFETKGKELTDNIDLHVQHMKQFLLLDLETSNLLYLHIRAGLGWVAEAMEITLLSCVGRAIQPEWGLSSSEESLISTVAFFGMLVGAYLWGAVLDSYGRKKGLLGAAIISTVAGLLSACAPNYTSLFVLRCIVGVGQGGGHTATDMTGIPREFVEHNLRLDQYAPPVVQKRRTSSLVRSKSMIDQVRPSPGRNTPTCQMSNMGLKPNNGEKRETELLAGDVQDKKYRQAIAAAGSVPVIYDNGCFLAYKLYITSIVS